MFVYNGLGNCPVNLRTLFDELNECLDNWKKPILFIGWLNSLAEKDDPDKYTDNLYCYSSYKNSLRMA